MTREEEGEGGTTGVATVAAGEGEGAEDTGEGA